MARLFTRHDAPSQVHYQELKQLARSQHRILAGTPGTLKRRSRRGTEYWVREHIRVDGRKDDQHLGTVAVLDDGRIRTIRAEIELAKALASGSSTLRVFGYQRIERKAAAVLAALFNRGLFQAGLTLIGAYAYGALLNECGISAPGYKTQDIDLARARPLAFALPLVVDLLVPGKHAGEVVPVKELGAHAQAIPLLDYLIKEPIDGVVLSPNQVIPVKLPSPERFVLHKLYSSQSRKTDRDKVRKDLGQAGVLAAVLEEDTPGRLSDAFRSMPAAARAAVKRGARAAAKLLDGAHPAAEAALTRLAGR